MRLSNLLACSFAVMILGSPAWAQEGDAREERGEGDQARQRRPQQQRQIRQLSAEKAKAAWEWQAKSVAKTLKLDEAGAKQLMRAYVASRQQYNEDRAMLRAAQQESGNARGGDRCVGEVKPLIPEPFLKKRSLCPS